MDPQEVAAFSAEPVTAMFKKRSAKGKLSVRKRQTTSPSASNSDSDFYSSEDEAGHKIKRRRRNGGTVTASSMRSTSTSAGDLTATKYSAGLNTTIKSSNDATKQSNWYDEDGSNALSAKTLLGTTRAVPAQAPDGTYKGLANQTTFIEKNPNAPSRIVGPVKAPTNIRTITVTDYSPDVCKDYKQTGFCGFGDGCKFLHAREDYKQGWQLDKEWENVTKGKRVTGGTKVASANRNADEDASEGEDEALEGIPFACIICREKYKEPVVTKCGHYFCESCALRRYKKDPSCAACGAGTGGVFNVAKGLKKLLDRKRARVAKRRQNAVEAGEEVSEEDEDTEKS